MAAILITLQAFLCGEMTYFYDGEWSRRENMSPLLRGMRGRESWVDSGSQELLLGPFPWVLGQGVWTCHGSKQLSPRQTGGGMDMSSKHTGLCPLGLHLC